MVNRAALLGSWKLEWAHVVRGDEVVDTAPFGPEPMGVLHYLPDGRMAALIAHADRTPMTGGRVHASDAARLQAARSFVAYAGTYEVDGDKVVHHVDMNSYPNDVGTDYVRYVLMDGDMLDLVTPSDLGEDQRPMRLRWSRLGGSASSAG